jgi:hypothetical protein
MRRGMHALVLALAALAALVAATPGARAQPAPLAGSEAARAAAGIWEISNAERDRSCLVTLRPPGTSATAPVTWENKCAELFPFSREAQTWNIGEMDAIQLLDGKGGVLLELTEVEGGLYEGERRGEGLFFLQSVAGAAAEERKPEALAGDWVFTAANGRALCRITLETRPVPPDALALRVKPGCAASVANARPAAWRIDRGELVVVAAGGAVWRFEETEPGVWQRLSPSAPPLRLVRP